MYRCSKSCFGDALPTVNMNPDNNLLKITELFVLFDIVITDNLSTVASYQRTSSLSWPMITEGKKKFDCANVNESQHRNNEYVTKDKVLFI